MHTGHGVEHAQSVRQVRIEKLEALLAVVHDSYNEKYPLDDVNDEGREVCRDADGLVWVKHTGQGVEHAQSVRQARIEKIEVMLADVQDSYNEKYPLDDVKDECREVCRDADGLAWVKHTGQGVEHAQQIWRVRCEKAETICKNRLTVSAISAWR